VPPLAIVVPPVAVVVPPVAVVVPPVAVVDCCVFVTPLLDFAGGGVTHDPIKVRR
jgi:hypothetical protein